MSRSKSAKIQTSIGGGDLEVYVNPDAKPGGHQFEAFYRLNIIGKPVVRASLLVNMDGDHKVPDTISSKHAELILLKYLLLDQEVFGRGASGRGVKLSVSTGAIRKLSKSKSSDDYLMRHGNFLRTRYAESLVEVNTSPAWIPDSDPVLTVSEVNLINTPDLKFHKLGLAISRHAYDRFIERLYPHLKNEDDPWLAMHKMFALGSWGELQDKADGSKVCNVVSYNGRYELDVVLQPVGSTYNVVTVIYPEQAKRRLPQGLGRR